MIPKISVIVPIYNVENYIGQCVQALLAQTLTDIEIILIDDQSPDNCPKICDQYAAMDIRIKVIHKKNEGLDMARNSGLDIANGEYVAFIDSDDYVNLDTYESLYTIAKEKEIDAAFFAYENFNEKGEVLGHNSSDVFSFYEGKDSIQNIILNMIGNKPKEKRDRDIQVSSCCAIYNRTVIKKNNIRFYSERELISEDLIFNIDFLSKANKIAITPHTYYHYRINTSSLTHTVRLDRIDKNKILFNYLTEKLSLLELGNDAQQRNIRMFIGHCRSSIMHVCKSNLTFKQKTDWLTEVGNDSVWKNIMKKYPYLQLPCKHGLPLLLIRYKMKYLLLLLSKIKT